MKNKRILIRLIALSLVGATLLLAGCDRDLVTPNTALTELSRITGSKDTGTGTQTEPPLSTEIGETSDSTVKPTEPQPTTVPTTAAPSTIPEEVYRIEVEAGTKQLTAADYFPDEPDLDETQVTIGTELTEAQLADAGASYAVTVLYRGDERKFTVTIVDTTPPVIKVQDIYIEVGGSVSYKKNAVVTDNSSNEVTLKVDNSAADIDKVGVYPIIYTATDSSGNVATARCNLVVSATKPITKEDVDPLIDELINQLIKPDMSKWDTCYTLWNWCRTKIKYSYDHYDPSNIYQGAYDGLKNKKGDCFVYYATFSLLLDRVGIENMLVSRVGGTSNHYWNLVNLGDGWYHCDSSPRKTGHTYYCFMQTDEQVAWYTEYYKEKPNYYTFDPDLYPPRETKIVFEHY